MVCRRLGHLYAEAEPEPVKAAVIEPSRENAGRIRAMPSIRRIAKEHGIDLASVDGSGRHGRITRKDILAMLDNVAAATTPEPTPMQPGS